MTPRYDLDYKSHGPKHDFECKWVEVIDKNLQGNLIIGVHYRHPLKHDEDYLKYLTKTLNVIKKEKKNVIITGDFNYNLLNYQRDDKTTNFLSVMIENFYLPHVIGPTRITDKKPSLIDNIFFNNINKNCVSGNLTYKLSDHLPSFMLIDEVDYNIKTKQTVFKRNFNKFNQEKFNERMMDEEVNNNIKMTNDANKKYEILHKHIINTLDDLAPLKKITKKRLKQSQKPWITTGMLKSISKKNKLYKKFIMTKEEKFYNNYKVYRDLLNRLIRNNKRNHYNEYFRNNLNNMKKMWKGINELTNKNVKNNMNSMEYIGPYI